MKRSWIFLCLGALMAVGQTAAAERPNIVFILADDLGYADPGFNGGTQIHTPHLDKLAREGTVLKSFYVQPLCSPTRAALLTGRYPMRHGLQVGVITPRAPFGLPLEERTLADALREAGYFTAICGKWHLGDFRREYWPNQRGFDHAYGHLFGMLDYFTHIRNGIVDWYRNGERVVEEGYTTHLIAREAVRVIREHGGERPFFLYVPFNAVHTPLQVPEEYMKPYQHLPEKRRKLAGMLAALDEAVGQIVAAVEEKGLRRNTLFVFSSDNGGPNPGRVTDNSPLRGGKATLYEGGVRVCAFATWDGHIPAGRQLDEPMHIVDWFPTLVKLAGGSLAPDKQKLPLDGRDIWPTLTAGAPSPHQEILLNAAPNAGAIRVGDWKLKLRRTREGEQVELFNLAHDIAEKNNLAAAHSDKVKELRARYERWAAQAAPPKNKPKL
ncbi:MAG: arylsulfatase [Verrucomicrobia bacterium]|nr:MAG: arylsulfatase [Verrucomicrobiota bacterium]